MEEFLHHNGEKYQDFLENIEDGCFEVDLSGNFTFFNDFVCRVIGYPREELMGMNNRQYTDQEEVQKVLQAYKKVYETGKPNRAVSWRITRKDGTKRYIEGSISLLKDGAGKPKGFRGIARDITDRRETEKVLRESEARYRNIFDNIEEAYYEVDLKGNLTFFNASAVATLGYTGDVMMGTNFRRYIDEENAGKLFDAHSKVFLTGKPVKGIDWELISKDGRKIPVESSISLMRNLQGNPVGFRGMIRDVTERKRAEKEREKLISELRQALQEVKVLSGLLPICASCKKIRNDEGYWEQIESYIGSRSKAEFSHGICPECSSKLYPELLNKKTETDEQ